MIDEDDDPMCEVISDEEYEELQEEHEDGCHVKDGEADAPHVDKNHPFKLTWKDDFDSLDEGRWKKTDNSSWSSNNATFMAS